MYMYSWMVHYFVFGRTAGIFSVFMITFWSRPDVTVERCQLKDSLFSHVSSPSGQLPAVNI